MTDAGATGPRVVERLAGWAAKVAWPGVPPPDQASVLDSIVDTVGVALAGSREPVCRLLSDYTRTAAAPGAAAVWGTADRLAPAAAALLNGTAAMAQEFDDRHVRHGHPSCVLVPALAAVGEAERLGGVDLLEGYCAGVGIFAATGFIYGAHLEPRLEPRGWHITSVLGTVAAAAGVARALRFDAGQVATAMGIAASMSAGLSANVGSPTKAVHAGRAAAAGVDAALLARAGLACSDGAIDGTHGAMVAFGPRGDAPVIGTKADVEAALAIAAEATSGLIRKRFPSFGATHLSIDAALECRRRLPADARLVSARLRLPTPRGGSAVSFRGRPATPSQARHSFRYVVAVALARGTVLPRHFDQDLFAPDIEAVWDLLSVDEAADETPESSPMDSAVFAEVTLRVEGGDEFRVRNDHPPRSISGAVVDEKFLGCAEEVLPRTQAEQLLADLRRLASLEELGSLFAFRSPAL